MMYIRRFSVALLSLLLLIPFSPTGFADDGQYTVPIYFGDSYQGLVRAYDSLYFNNTYLSLTDLSAILSGTDKNFRFERVVSSSEGEYFSITRGQNSVLSSGAEGLIPRTLTAVLNPTRNRLLVDGTDRKYYTHNPKTGDLYMSLTDVQLLLDLSMIRSSGSLVMYLDFPFIPDLNVLQADGYFNMLDSAFVGDAETGEVLFTLHGEDSVPVASLSKLLSFLVLKEAISAGEISASDYVQISRNAEAVSLSGDGIISLKAGESVPFSELMEGMLVASSNECALALAEHLCGSEEAFVTRMNRRALELGLYSVRMFNCSGLPSYTDGAVPVKRQNLMSADDLFRLTCYILRYYPEITEITSSQLSHLPSLNDYWTANSNPLIYNLPGVDGLKTGSTNRAGYCLVATLPVRAVDGIHHLVLVLLGAETADIRGQAAEILLRYGRMGYIQ